ncbi:H-2 class II histocompatibility antigen, E-S beta chain-like [Carettochelys insculpta]|uniref:H-2 class II histocompatibility antigen, E-S beta chain-like n=1 Tax=Carettochelys insculpta TaxID=44489 RepID=UPI003EB8A318
MGPGRILGAGSRWAGALLVTLAVLRPDLAHCMEPPGWFLYQEKGDCYYTNGTQQVRFLLRYIYDRQQTSHFDSDLGLFVADSELDRTQVEAWNKDPAGLAQARGEVDRFCRHNYGAVAPFTVERRVPPRVKVFPAAAGSRPQPQPRLLVCSVTGFYPGAVEVTWLKNGQEQRAGVVSTELLRNGDWTFQLQVMLETSPRRGDLYTCRVQHVSLSSPLAVQWEAQSDAARSKMLTGVGGFVLGLIFLVPGLVIYLKNKKGRPVPQPTGLLS